MAAGGSRATRLGSLRGKPPPLTRFERSPDTHRGTVGLATARRRPRCLWLLAACVLTAALAPTEAIAGRRFVLAVGENRGLPGDEPLRFAVDDARRVRDTLVEVGGVQSGDATLVEGGRAEAVRAALERLRGTLATSAAPGDSLVVYVSSHGDEQALHLDGTTLPLAEVVEFIKQAPVELALLIVDACHSGAVTRKKGLTVLRGQPPVHVDATGLAGRVFISASGLDEYAQESDALKGSTFTHHLLAGLRGAADSSRDGRVTLDEAYAWSWARTMEATFASRGGVQRPAFKVELRGEGQLVLSTPGEARGRLALDVDAPGLWLVVQEATGAVVAEVQKPRGAMALALAPGAYRARLRTGDGVLERAVVVPAVGVARVSGGDLERASLVRVALKGGAESTWLAAAGVGATSGVLMGLGLSPGFALRLHRESAADDFIDDAGLALDLRSSRSIGSGFRNDELELRAALGHRLTLSRLTVAVAAELGALLVLQRELPGGGERSGLEAVAQVSAEARLFVVRPVGVFAQGQAGLVLLSKTTGLGLVPRAGGALGLFVAF